MKMNNFQLKIFICFLIFFNILPSNIKFHNENNNYEKIFFTALLNFHKKIPLTKIYLHTDKQNYSAGEIIYFKAYLLNFYKHKLDSLNTNLYVELINPFKNIILQKRFLIKNGTSYGNIELPDTLIDGIYQLRSYTNFMRNFDEKFFFTQNIFLKNTFNKIPSYSFKQYNKFYKSFLKNKDKFNVKIYQDDIIQNNKKLKKITISVKNYYNEPISTNIKFFDDKKHNILENTTNKYGICSFYLSPKYKKYNLSVTYKSKTKKFPLYLTKENLAFFDIHENIEDLNIKISKSLNFSKNIFFVAQSNGEIIYFKSISNTDSLNFKINKNVLPPGLSTFTLLSNDFNVLYEKLYANPYQENESNIAFHIEKDINNNSQRIIYIHSNNNSTNLFYNISISINTETDTVNIKNINIINYILYGSDLGLTNNECIIFNDLNENKNFINNEFLSTFKWERFLWNDILSNNFPFLPYQIEKGLTINGKVTSEIFSIPLKDCIVKLYVLNSYNDIFSTLTDENGNFFFENLYYYGDIDIKIEALKPNKKRNLLIILPDNPAHQVKNFYPQPFAYNLLKNNLYNNPQIIKSYDLLKEKVTTELVEKNKNIIEGIYGTPDYVITSDQIPQGYTNILQVLQGRVPGVDVYGNNVIIRGVKTIYGSTDPLYLLDGVPVSDVNSILSIPIEDVERIEIVKGPTTAIYGSRGANGIIAVYTRRGEFLTKGVLALKIQGFSKPLTFKPSEINNNKYTTLLWEPEIILSNSKSYSFKFKVPENVSNYNLIIQGITNNGKLISYIVNNLK